jgi:hypothetical protein
MDYPPMQPIKLKPKQYQAVAQYIFDRVEEFQSPDQGQAGQPQSATPTVGSATGAGQAQSATGTTKSATQPNQ